MDKLYSDVQKYLKWTWQPNKDDIFISCPPGWIDLITAVVSAADALDSSIDRVYIDKGVLRVELVSKSNSEITKHILKWIASSLAKESVTTCLVTGKYSRRRKLAKGWPSLCPDVWIEYANQMPEEDWLK